MPFAQGTALRLHLNYTLLPAKLREAEAACETHEATMAELKKKCKELLKKEREECKALKAAAEESSATIAALTCRVVQYRGGA